MSVGTAAIIEMDAERDRKTCLALDLKVAGANRELAQWLIDHPSYSNMDVAGWLGCNETRIRRLRTWARTGFVELPNSRSKRSAAAPKAPLESLENSDSDEDPEMASDDVADPATVEDNLLYTLSRMNEHARIFKKFIKLSAFDREAEVRITTAIDRMIEKWRSTQATLTKRVKDHG